MEDKIMQIKKEDSEEVKIAKINCLFEQVYYFKQAIKTLFSIGKDN